MADRAVLARLLQAEHAAELTWRTEAACRGVDPELFYPERGSQGWKEAKLVCQTCPVVVACYDYAIVAGERHGVWGGLTELERKRRRLAWQRTRRAAEARGEEAPSPSQLAAAAASAAKPKRVAVRRRSTSTADPGHRVQEMHRMRAGGRTAQQLSVMFAVNARSVYRWLARRCGVNDCWCAQEAERVG